MTSYSFGRSEICNERNYDAPYAPWQGKRYAGVCRRAAKNPGDDQPFHHANGGVDGQIFPEDIVGLSRNGEENCDSEEDADREAKYAEGGCLSPACRVGLPQSQA